MAFVLTVMIQVQLTKQLLRLDFLIELDSPSLTSHPSPRIELTISFTRLTKSAGCCECNLFSLILSIVTDNQHLNISGILPAKSEN